MRHGLGHLGNREVSAFRHALDGTKVAVGSH